MINCNKTKKTYYQALLNRDSQYEGIFFAGIKTTGVFCHATCPARKPKFENCEFFKTAEEALLEGYRPCKRCNPLSYPQEFSGVIKKLIQLVEQNPEKRWKEKDFEEMGIHSATARRQFKKKFGMTFVQYARSRRMGIALKEIRKGKKVINAQVDTGYESASGFNDAFSKIIGNTPQKAINRIILYTKLIDTVIGTMIAIADESHLYLLEFVDRRGLEKEIERLRNKLNASIIPGSTDVLLQIESELTAYFTKKSSVFKTPLKLIGSDFQKSVWSELCKIPVGETTTYSNIATSLGREKAVRAVGNANGANQLAIVIPCHRVIKNDGSIGGYGGGVARKHYLLKHEKELSSLLKN